MSKNQKRKAMGVDPLGFIKDTKESAKRSDTVVSMDTNNQESTLKTKERSHLNSSQKGLPENWTRATYIVRDSIVDQLKSVAYWERKQLKEVVEEAFSSYLSDKKTKPIPHS